MKRIFVVLNIVLLLLSSCSLGGSNMGKHFFTDSEISKKTFEQIIESIYDKDSETLKGMFSKTAIMASKDIDANLTDLFNFYNGEYITYDDIGGPMVTDERNADGTGGKRKELQSTFNLTSDKGEYQFAIKEYIIDTNNPDNIGIYSLYITNATDSKSSVYWGDGNWLPGITIMKK